MIASLLSEEWGGFKYSTSKRNHSPNIIFVTLGVFFVTHGVFFITHGVLPNPTDLFAKIWQFWELYLFLQREKLS